MDTSVVNSHLPPRAAQRRTQFADTPRLADLSTAAKTRYLIFSKKPFFKKKFFGFSE